MHKIDSNMLLKYLHVVSLFLKFLLFFVLIGLGDGEWVRVEEGEITLCYIVPLIIISTSPDRPRPQKK
jgi:hypothetical protein